MSSEDGDRHALCSIRAPLASLHSGRSVSLLSLSGAGAAGSRPVSLSTGPSVQLQRLLPAGDADATPGRAKVAALCGPELRVYDACRGICTARASVEAGKILDMACAAGPRGEGGGAVASIYLLPATGRHVLEYRWSEETNKLKLKKRIKCLSEPSPSSTSTGGSLGASEDGSLLAVVRHEPTVRIVTTDEGKRCGKIRCSADRLLWIDGADHRLLTTENSTVTLYSRDPAAAGDKHSWKETCRLASSGSVQWVEAHDRLAAVCAVRGGSGATSVELFELPPSSETGRAPLTEVLRPAGTVEAADGREIVAARPSDDGSSVAVVSLAPETKEPAAEAASVRTEGGRIAPRTLLGSAPARKRPASPAAATETAAPKKTKVLTPVAVMEASPSDPAPDPEGPSGSDSEDPDRPTVADRLRALASSLGSDGESDGEEEPAPVPKGDLHALLAQALASASDRHVDAALRTGAADPAAVRKTLEGLPGEAVAQLLAHLVRRLTDRPDGIAQLLPWVGQAVARCRALATEEDGRAWGTAQRLLMPLRAMLAERAEGMGRLLELDGRLRMMGCGEDVHEESTIAPTVAVNQSM